jgi:exodeoxyribonuclease VIII
MNNEDFFGSSSPAPRYADVMLDLESGGVEPTAPILAIGAVSFDFKELKLGERFYVTVDLQSCIDQGAVLEAGTFMWWMQQSDQARQALTVGQRVHINEAMHQFGRFLTDKCAPEDHVKIWGNGVDFDCVLLKAHYRRAGLDAPWRFWNQRCFRTVKGLYPNVEPVARTGTHHNALDDAIWQVEHLFAVRRALREKKQ